MNSYLVIILYLILILLSLTIVIYLYWKFWFCRKPKRQIPTGEKVIICPANGIVAVIKKFSANVTIKKWNQAKVNVLGSDVDKTGWFLLIVMNPLNVHVQRAPTNGKILFTKHSKGTFKNAVLGAQSLQSLENEHNEILMQTKYGKIKIVQIAGMLARRIECYCKKGQSVKKGQEIGFINLGSQVALLLPENVKLNVKLNQVVFDGETIIGEFQ